MVREEANSSVLKLMNIPQEQSSGGASGALLHFHSPWRFFCKYYMWHTDWTQCCSMLHSSPCPCSYPLPKKPQRSPGPKGTVWTNRCMYILVLQFMLILTDFYCQQARPVSFHEENSTTNDSLKTLHFKGLFYKCVTELFSSPSQVSLQEQQSWWIMWSFASDLCAAPFLGGRAGDLTELCQPQQKCLCQSRREFFLISTLCSSTCTERG